MRGPEPERMKSGVPPTAPKARTGELTPPGIRRTDWSKSSRLRSYMMFPGSAIEGGEAPRRLLDVERLEEGGDDREHVGARGDSLRGVGGIDTADRRDRQAGFRSGLREELER